MIRHYGKRAIAIYKAGNGTRYMVFKEPQRGLYSIWECDPYSTLCKKRDEYPDFVGTEKGVVAWLQNAQRIDNIHSSEINGVRRKRIQNKKSTRRYKAAVKSNKPRRASATRFLSLSEKRKRNHKINEIAQYYHKRRQKRARATPIRISGSKKFAEIASNGSFTLRDADGKVIAQKKFSNRNAAASYAAQHLNDGDIVKMSGGKK